MKRFKALLTPASEFSGHVMALLSGAAVALTVSYLVQPILTRLYTPAQFGLLDTFVALLALIVPFSSAKFEDAIVLPDSDEEAGHVLNLSLSILLFSTMLLASILLFRKNIALALGVPELANWLLLVPPTLLLVRLTMVGELWNVRQKRFKKISGVNIARTTTMNVAKISGASFGLAGLFAGYVIGFLTAVGLYARGIGRAARLSFSQGGVTGIRNAARRYRNFPRFTLPASILGAMVNRLPFLLLLYFFTAEVVGLYGRAFAAIMVPLSVVGTAISNVFYVYAAERRGTELLTSSTVRVHDRLVLFGMYPVLAVIVAGPQLFSFIFGTGWEISGDYARIVGFWLFLSAVSSPLTRLFDVLERQELELKVTLVIFMLQTTALVLGGLSGSPVTALLLLAVAGSAGRIFQLLMLHRIAGVRFPQVAWPFLKYGMRSVPGVALLVLALYLNTGPLWIAAAAAFGAVAYGTLSLGDIRSAFERPSPEN